MRAAVVREYGSLEVLRIEDLPAPVAGPGQVLVDVHAAAANYPDVLLIANRYQIPAPLPFTPGSELAGVVAAVGPGVHGFEPGSRVLGSMMVGAFAEQVALPVAALSPSRTGSTCAPPPRSGWSMRPRTRRFAVPDGCAPVRPCWCSVRAGGSVWPRSTSGERWARA